MVNIEPSAILGCVLSLILILSILYSFKSKKPLNGYDEYNKGYNAALSSIKKGKYSKQQLYEQACNNIHEDSWDIGWKDACLGIPNRTKII